MKKLAIIYSEYSPVIDAISANLVDVEISTFTSIPENHLGYDLLVFTGEGNKIPQNLEAINVHYSLLPAFIGENPLKQAFMEGVKITGISFYYTNSKKIIAQYPIFISNSSHYDEVEQELKYLEQTLYPLIIDKVFKNEPFEIKNLLKKDGCSNNCGGCNKCIH